MVPARVAALACLLLAACSGGEQAGPRGEAGEHGSAELSPLAKAEAAEAANRPAEPDFRSDYSVLQVKDCKLVFEADEADAASWECHGFDGNRLVLHTADGRMDIDAGIDNEIFETIGAFNDYGETIEWRLGPGGQPVAIIYRLRDASLETGGSSVLFVETIGREGAPGCVIGRVSGGVPNANQRAREIADSKAEGFDCASGSVTSIGRTD